MPTTPARATTPYGPPASRDRKAAPASPPAPTISAEAARLDKLDNDQFESQAAAFAVPTINRPALITTAEVERLRTGYGTGSGRLDVLTRITRARQAVWEEQQGEDPFERLSDGDRAKAQAFFAANGVRLLSETREAPPNPLRRAEPVPAKAKDTSKDTSTPPAAPLPLAAVGLADDIKALATQVHDLQTATAQPGSTAMTLALLHTLVQRAEVNEAHVDRLLSEVAAMRELLAAAPAPAAAASDVPMCAIHKTPMAKREGKNGSFWSCPKKLDDGSWCPYKPKA